MQGQFHCNGYTYDNLLFGDFDTVAAGHQLLGFVRAQDKAISWQELN